MTLYRGVAERLVDIYDFDWQNNHRMKETCICSVENVIANGINLLLIVALMLISGWWFEIVIYFFTFGVLRCYSGGAHAKNHLKCIAIYTFTMLVSIWSTKMLFPEEALYTGILMLLCMLFAGVMNRKYAAKQKSIGNRSVDYRKKVFVTYCMISLIMVSMFLVYIGTGQDVYRQAVMIQTCAMVAQSVGVFMGRSECAD